MPKLTIVIPVYNSEKYLDRCIESVLCQSFSDTEVICVDDGSIDNSGRMLDEYAKKDSRLRVIHQKNKGVSATRKLAISLANGEYIAFVDADDYVDQNYYSDLMAQVYDTDIVMCGYFHNDKKVYMPHDIGLYQTDLEMDYFYNNMLMFGNNTIGVSGHLFTKIFITKKLQSIVNDITPGLYFREDNELIFRYLLCVKSVCISDICGYHYTVNPGSITHTLHDDFLINLNKYYISMLGVFSKHKYADIMVKQFKRRTLFDLYCAPGYMGFECDFINYINPFIATLCEKKYILYGAGTIGRDYFRQMKANGCLPVAWVDKDTKDNFEGFKISKVSEIDQHEFDYIVIAINNTETVKEVKKMLLNKGVEESKILWKKSINMILC